MDVMASEAYDYEMAAEEEGEMAGDYDDNDILADQYEDLSDLSLSESEDTARADDIAKPKFEIGQEERVKMIHQRRFLEYLDQQVAQNQYFVDKTREELKRCKEHIQDLENQRDQLFIKITEAESNENVSAVNRLRAHHAKICMEMENELEIQHDITNNLEQAQYVLSQVEVERGKYLLLEEDLKDKENSWQQQSKTQAVKRREREQKLQGQALARKKASERQRELSLMEKEAKQQNAIEGAERSHQKHEKFLQNTINKLKERELTEELRQKEHLEKRMKTITALKRDITMNRENLRAQQARDKAYAERDRQAWEMERQRVLSEGGNPDLHLLKKQRLHEFEQIKQNLKNKQKEKEVEIVNKLLEEEERIKRRKEQQPYLWSDSKAEKAKRVKPHRKLKLQVFEQYKQNFEDNELSNDMPLDISRDRGNEDSEEEDETDSQDERLNLPDSDTPTHDENTTNLAKPEFEGLWRSHKAYKVPKDVIVDNKNVPTVSKMEKEILEKVLEKHREGIVITQIAGGKQFKGQPFYSKPSVIEFKDFDVGKTYKKRVTLTNVSYSVNYCKLIGITEHLKDFIEILFDPPGQMSAGLTCEMLVSFKPMINEDLEGQIDFLAQTGPFSIPIICATKKCDLRVEQNMVDFGVSIIGETLKKTITLVNDGALATTFDFYKVTGFKQRSLTTAETSLGRLTTADTMKAASPDSVEVLHKEKPAEKAEEKILADVQHPAEEGKEKKEVKIDDGTEDFADGLTNEALNTIDPLAGLTPLPEDEDISSLDGMKVGQISSGEIKHHSSVKLEIVWSPTIPINAHAEFVISFVDQLSSNINVDAIGRAVDVPVWVERQDVDLKICMYDRLYQDTVLVHNRATTALRLKFEVCKELKNHLELLPKTGYIQAQSTFSAQLKFLPRTNLAEEAGKYFDPETGVLQAPLLITVANQTRPVPFRVHAVVTTSELEFDTSNVNFGSCTIQAAVKCTVKLTNKSILPQKFGFMGIPQYIDIQPNDGFGTILPLETIELDIIFKPDKAQDYNFDLTCRSLINRDFKLKCHGIGVHPPLELSHQLIHFKATTLYDVSTAAIHVINNHTSTNEFTHPVPRIGKGEIAPVGPTSFEFDIPEGAPITVSPSVGTVMPGKKARIEVRFTPTLSEDDIKQEAVRMITKTLEMRAAEEHKQAVAAKEKDSQESVQEDLDEIAAKGKKGGKPPSPPKGKKPEAGTSAQVKSPAPIKAPSAEDIHKGSDEYAAAQVSLLRQFAGDFNSFLIPCYVASGQCKNPGDLPYRLENTLYLEVHCPTVQPQLVVISDNGRTMTDFGDVSIGQSVIKSVSIQNISNKRLDLKSSILDTAGPFQMLNALRSLPADASHTILVCFTPQQGQVFQEVLNINTGTSTLSVTLKGNGVSPVVKLSVEDNMDIGAVIAGEYREEIFTIENTSSLAVQYSIKMDSQSLLHYNKAQEIPSYLSDDKQVNLVGPQNFNGQNVFDCVPAEGVIPAGGSRDITVTFAPDHPSDFYSDGVRLELFGQDEVRVFKLTGQAKSHIMYISGGDPLQPPVQSLAIQPDSDTEELQPGTCRMLVSLYSVVKDESYTPARKEITIGCVRTMAVSQKKNGEWTFDSTTGIANLGFNIDPLKGMLEAGTKKSISITWTPPPDHNPSQPMEASINVTVSGDVKDVYTLILRGYVVSQ